jgi:hypothetical protein
VIAGVIDTWDKFIVDTGDQLSAVTTTYIGADVLFPPKLLALEKGELIAIRQEIAY